MAVIRTTPELVLENYEATAFELVAKTFDYVCQSMGDKKINKCHGCPLYSLCNSTSDGYSRADEFRRIAKECKSK